MTDPFAPHRPVAQAIAALLHPHAEVVIHDLKTDRVVEIWNAFSHRKAGDDCLLGDDIEVQLDRDFFGPYEKAAPDGARLKSITAALRDSRGRRIGILCINLDVSQFDQAAKLLAAFTRIAEPRPEAMFRQDWREQINLMIRAFLERRRKALKALDRDERIALVAELDSAGLFEARNAAPHVASAMEISRATVYALLNAARGKPQKAAE
ncbi:MAG TPA: PAS domain-containing protein [Alphaproteobacteria bacterium]|nr:PAS domain-containing protein [Alphaproteobacteria bacterium]